MSPPSPLETAVDAVRLAGELLPDFIAWVSSMLKIGRTKAEMQRDIQDRRAEIERMWARAEADLAAKHRGSE